MVDLPEKVLPRIYKWVACFLLLLAIACNVFEVALFGSSYIVFYGLSVLALLVSMIERFLSKAAGRRSSKDVVERAVFYGSLTIVILFFPPIYILWGTWIFGP